MTLILPSLLVPVKGINFILKCVKKKEINTETWKGHTRKEGFTFQSFISLKRHLLNPLMTPLKVLVSMRNQ